ncbi:MAG TPA: VWA domain-containing protein, partial [Thermoanaerobaculia bacterium]|nr:VWA domain-containing protein [Thermoanaerobaculia bacterium]
GLTADDFEVRDNGVVQPVTHFAEYEDKQAPRPSAQTAAAPAPQPAAPPPQKRTLVLFVERQVLRPAQADSFVASMKKLLHDTVRPGDSAAVVSFGHVTKVEQDFTGDLAHLDAAVDRLRPLFERFGQNTEGEAIQNEYMQELLDEAAAESGTTEARSVIMSGTVEATRQLVDIRRKVYTLNMLVNTMAGVDGRKAVFLATRRFGKYAGWEYIGRGLLQMEQGSDAQFFLTTDLRDELTRNANAAGVTFYPIYPEGYVERPRTNAEGANFRPDHSKSDGILLNETVAIGELADRTGGVAGWGVKDIERIANAMRDDLSSYYSLAFRAPKGVSTHKVTVTAKERGYTVRARREFVEKTDDMKMSDRILAALYQPQKASSIPVDVQILDKKKLKNGWSIPIVIRVPAASLTALPDTNGRSGVFRVYAASGGLLGINGDVHQKSQPFTIPAGAKDAATKIFIYSFEMRTDTRTDRIVIGIYDELSKQYGIVRVKL